MRRIRGACWFAIFCWISFGYRTVLMEVLDTQSNTIKHIHRRKPISTDFSPVNLRHFHQNNLNATLPNAVPTLEPPTSKPSLPTSSAVNNHIFMSPSYSIVQAQTLTTAVMHCEIAELGNSTVTWKRRRDYQILTFGLLTYSSDIRFFTRNVRNGRDWSLHIRYVNAADAGLYECQISSHPPASIFVELQLLEAHAEILGATDKVVQAGSALILTCIVRRCTEIPEYIFWYHDERMINYDHHVTASNTQLDSNLMHLNNALESEGTKPSNPSESQEVPSKPSDSDGISSHSAETQGISPKALGLGRLFNTVPLEDEARSSIASVGSSEVGLGLDVDVDVDGFGLDKVVNSLVRHHRQSSELLIANASVRHSGNYSCVPAKAKPSSVTVHVLRVEKPAAMQHNKNNSSKNSISTIFLIICYFCTSNR